MGLRIGTNMASLQANRALAHSSEDQRRVYTRLATGNRITEAGDDAAGLSISENLRSQIRSMNQAERNANDGISFAQVAEGGLTEIGNMLVRMRELSVQAASDTIGDKERGYIQKEVVAIQQEMDRIANSTQYNGTQLLNGQSSKSQLDFQVGIRNTESDRIKFNINENDVRTSTLGVEGLEMTTVDKARDAMDQVDKAIDKVFGARATLGATQNKLHATVSNDMIARENLQFARSRIADTDIAAETSELVRGNILQSASVAVLAQANSAPMAALKLI